jgi:hypothetical protein
MLPDYACPEAAGDAEQLEGAALDGWGRGDDGESRQAAGGLAAVGGDGGQVVQQGGEAVHGSAIGGGLGGVLGQRRGRAAGGSDRAGPGGPGGGGVVVFEQDGRELLLHVPDDVAGERADQHVGADPAGEPVADGPDQEVGVQAAEHPLDVSRALQDSTALLVPSTWAGTLVRITHMPSSAASAAISARRAAR